MFVEQYIEHRTDAERVHLLVIELEHHIFSLERTDIEHRTLFDPSLLQMMAVECANCNRALSKMCFSFLFVGALILK